MRDTLKSLIIILTVTCFITACSTTNTAPRECDNDFIIDDNAVTDLTLHIPVYGKAPHREYEVIGHISVNKYNHVGIKRQHATITRLMRQQADKMGGDAVIKTGISHHHYTADVIKYKAVKFA
ncbi:MAG: hypothetical protein ACE365_06305 [Gammaproteobacteria bacterium]